MLLLDTSFPVEFEDELAQRFGDNDAWIAATALAYDATLIGREKAFKRVPRLDYVSL